MLFKRKMIKIGDSAGITIPDDVRKSYGLEKGDDIYLISGVVDDFLLVDLRKLDKDELWEVIKR